MGKTKKPFIDKKKSSTYHLLHRSQRDVAGADDESGAGSGVVLWPSSDNNSETDQKVLLGNQKIQDSDSDGKQSNDNTLSSWKNKLAEVGLVDDFDYERHTKPIRGDGAYLSNNAMGATKREVGAMLNARALNIEDEIVQEVDRQLDSIALTSDCMDDEIAQMLFGDFEEGEFEELNDEFLLDAAKEPEQTADDEPAFNYASHIQGLIEKAKMENDGFGGELATVHEAGRKDQDFFANAKRVDKYNSDDDSGHFDENDFNLEIEGVPGIVPKLTEAEEQALCDKFNEALAEYDSDDFGEGYSDDDAVGDLPLEGDTRIEDALDDFLMERKDDIFMQGHRHYMEGNNNGGSGFSALVGTKMVHIKDIVEPATPAKGDIQPMNEILGQADDTLRGPHEAPPTEEIFIDGKSYFSERMKNPWDCESILSTYSNLDNNPTTISNSGRRRRRKPKTNLGSLQSDDTTNKIDEHETIRLSEKTGLPIGVLESGRHADYADASYCPTYDGADTYMSVNKGVSRSKNETAEEKKLRKLNVKKERQLARMQKKMMKEAFNEEFSKRHHEVLTDDVGGKTVFRF
jgi:protein LTV1